MQPTLCWREVAVRGKFLACVVSKETTSFRSSNESLGIRWKESEQKTTHLQAISLRFRRIEARKESQRPGMEHPARNRRTCNENPSHRSQSHHRTRRGGKKTAISTKPNRNPRWPHGIHTRIRRQEKNQEKVVATSNLVQ